MKRFGKILGFLIVITLILVIFIGRRHYNTEQKIDINEVLSSESYSGLSIKVKKYIEDVYNNTGEVMLLEENKKYNEPYLNPDYIDYLEGNYASDSGYIPSETLVDYEYPKIVDGTTLPEKYDLRNVDGRSYVTSIKNQGSEGLCWDFAMMAAFESKLLKMGLYDEENEPDFSERHLDYAIANPKEVIDIGKNPWGKGRSLGTGGSASFYLSAAARGIAPIEESLYNHDYTFRGVLKPEEVYNRELSIYSIDGVYSFTQNSTQIDDNMVNSIKSSIIEHGAAAVDVPIGAGCGEKYIPKGDEELLYPRFQTNALVYNPGGCVLNHMEAVVGWDDNYEHTLCVTSDFKTTKAQYDEDEDTYSCSVGSLYTIHGAWIIKNSWGTNTNATYAYLAYNSVRSSYTIITDIGDNDVPNIYLSDNVYTNANTVFNKSGSAEVLNKIKFGVRTNDITLNIYVSKTGSESDLVKYSTVHFPYAGLYTIDLSDKNIVLDHNQFSVRIGYSSYTNTSLPYGVTVFTDNVDDSVFIDMQDVSLADLLDKKSFSSLESTRDNLLLFNGKSRNLFSDDIVDYKIFNSDGVEVTDSFSFYRKYAITNIINTLVGFDDDLESGIYTAKVYYNNVEYDTFDVDITGSIIKFEGSGTLEDPYIVDSNVKLNAMRDHLTDYFRLTTDLDLTYDTQDKNGLFYNGGKGFVPIGSDDSFRGGFDGGNHTITGLYSDTTTDDPHDLSNGGLFDTIKNARVENLTLVNPIIKGGFSAGAIAGYATSLVSSGPSRELILKNLKVVGGSVSAEFAGGLFGELYIGSTSTIVSNLYNSADVNGTSAAGGIISDFYSERTNSLSFLENLGTIRADYSASGLIGTLVLFNNSQITISNSLNIGKIIDAESQTQIAGCIDDDVVKVLKLNNIYVTGNVLHAFDEDESDIRVDNVQVYSIFELADNSIYDSWSNFSDNYEKIDGHIPILIDVSFPYTVLNDITIGKDDVVNIYDYIENNDIDDVIIGEYDNSKISIDSEGFITVSESGVYEIPIKSLHDGYDGFILVEYDSHEYTITLSENTTTYTGRELVPSVPLIKDNNGEDVVLDYSYHYYSDVNCAIELSDVPINVGDYYVKVISGDIQSNCAKHTIALKDLNITLDSKSITYGDSIPLLTFRIDGFVNKESINNLTGELRFKIGDVDISEITQLEVGTYVIQAYGLESLNYNIIYHTANLIVNEIVEEIISKFPEKVQLDNDNVLFKLEYNKILTYQDIMNSLDITSSSIVVKNSSNQVVENDSASLGTGSVIELANSSYTIVVKGDLNGDARITALDYISIREHIMELNIISNQYYFRAGDMNGDSRISALDYIELREVIMN